MYSVFGIIFFILGIHESQQHGYLADPPQRSSLWRENPEAPVNYNDNQLYCGGRENLRLMGGRCGTCGDPFQGPHENEAGGKYALGVIARNYSSDQQTIPVKVVLTAYHKGYYEFKICPHNNPTVPVSQSCLDEHPLEIKEGSRRHRTRYYPSNRGTQWLNLVLPRGLECSQCVLQWRYKTGNSWGVNGRGRGCIGCGNQEEFWNCADIQIRSQRSSTDRFVNLPSSDSEEDEISLSGIQLLNQWFSPPSKEQGHFLNENPESDSDESEDEGRWVGGRDSWSGILQSDHFEQSVTTTQQSRFSSTRNIRKLAPTRQPTDNPWQRITNVAPTRADPWGQLTGRPNNRHDSKSKSNILQNTRTQQQKGQNDNRLSNNWRLLWQPQKHRNPINNSRKTQNSVRNNHNRRQITNQVTRNRSILAPISPLMALLGGAGSQVQFSFLPEDDLQRLNFLG